MRPFSLAVPGSPPQECGSQRGCRRPRGPRHPATALAASGSRARAGARGARGGELRAAGGSGAAAAAGRGAGPGARSAARPPAESRRPAGAARGSGTGVRTGRLAGTVRGAARGPAGVGAQAEPGSSPEMTRPTAWRTIIIRTGTPLCRDEVPGVWFGFFHGSSKDRATGGFLCESAVSNVGPPRNCPVWSVGVFLELTFKWSRALTPPSPGQGLQQALDAFSCSRRLMQVQISNSERKDPPAGRLLVGEGLGLK